MVPLEQPDGREVGDIARLELVRAALPGPSFETAVSFLLGSGTGFAPPAWSDIDRVYVIVDLAAAEGAGPVAAGSLRLSPDGRTAQLRQVRVSPAAAGRGVDRRLLEEVCDLLRADGVDRVVALATGTDGDTPTGQPARHEPGAGLAGVAPAVDHEADVAVGAAGRWATAVLIAAGFEAVSDEPDGCSDPEDGRRPPHHGSASVPFLLFEYYL